MISKIPRLFHCGSKFGALQYIFLICNCWVLKIDQIVLLYSLNTVMSFGVIRKINKNVVLKNSKVLIRCLRLSKRAFNLLRVLTKTSSPGLCVGDGWMDGHGSLVKSIHPSIQEWEWNLKQEMDDINWCHVRWWKTFLMESFPREQLSRHLFNEPPPFAQYLFPLLLTSSSSPHT